MLITQCKLQLLNRPALNKLSNALNPQVLAFVFQAPPEKQG